MWTTVLDMWVVIHGQVKHGLACTCIRLADKRAAEKGNERGRSFAGHNVHSERRGKMKICVDKAVVSSLHRNGACPRMEWVGNP
jgi:hypothetical protein